MITAVASGDEAVLGLEIAMEDAVPVQRGDGREELLDQGEHPRPGERAREDQIAERGRPEL